MLVLGIWNCPLKALNSEPIPLNTIDLRHLWQLYACNKYNVHVVRVYILITVSLSHTSHNSLYKEGNEEMRM